MSTAVLDKLIEERDAELERMDALAGADDFNPEDIEFVQGRSAVEALNAKIKARGEFMALRNAANELTAMTAKAGRRDTADQARNRDRTPETLGEILTRSDAYETYVRTKMGTSGRVDVPMDVLTRAPLTTTSGGGSPWQSPSRIGIAAPARQTPLLDAVGRVRVNSNSVEWITYPAAAPPAAIVAEGAQKPEAALTASIVTVTLDTIAHYAEATRQLLEDSTAARDFIDAELSRGVLDKIEAEIAATINAATLPAATGDDLMSAIRVGVGAVQSAGFGPDVVVLNPADYAALDIQVFGSTLLGPSITGRFWGLTPVPAGAVPAGTAYVGDMGVAVNYLERTSVTTYVTDSHAGNFTKNVFTFLAEARGKAVVTRAEALAKCTVTTPLAKSK